MEIPRHWRLKQQRYGLVGEVCSECDTKIFPPRDNCPECNHHIGPFNPDLALARTRALAKKEHLKTETSPEPENVLSGVINLGVPDLVQ
jgi:hypothetical protein